MLLYFLLSYTASHCRCREWGLIFKHLGLITGKGDREAQVSTHSRWYRSWHPRKKYRPGEEGRGPGSTRKCKQSWGLLRRCEMPLLNARAGQETTKPGTTLGDLQHERPLCKHVLLELPVPFIHMGFLHRVLTWLLKGSTIASSSRYSCNSSLNFFFQIYLFKEKLPLHLCDLLQSQESLLLGG